MGTHVGHIAELAPLGARTVQPRDSAAMIQAILDLADDVQFELDALGVQAVRHVQQHVVVLDRKDRADVEQSERRAGRARARRGGRPTVQGHPERHAVGGDAVPPSQLDHRPALGGDPIGAGHGDPQQRASLQRILRGGDPGQTHHLGIAEIDQRGDPQEPSRRDGQDAGDQRPGDVQDVERRAAVFLEDLAEHAARPMAGAGVMYRGAEQRPGSGFRLLTEGEDMHLVPALDEAFDQPEQARDHPHFAAPVHAAGGQDGDLQRDALAPWEGRVVRAKPGMSMK